MFQMQNNHLLSTFVNKMVFTFYTVFANIFSNRKTFGFKRIKQLKQI
jgi:hypothetical protein